MPTLAEIVLILWIIISMILFFRLSPQDAVLVIIFGGSLMLPLAEIDVPGLPALNKISITSIGLLIGGIISPAGKQHPIKLTALDLPMLSWCTLSPLTSSVLNGQGIYYGISGALENLLTWGILYWTGRRYFGSRDSLKKVSWAFVIGGAVYVPLILWELRMSPRLHRMIYGFFAHSWRQHFRYGGYRPIVFMEHGIMVAIFMAAVTTILFWYWRTGTVEKIKNLPISVAVLTAVVVTIFCRTAAGWLFMAIGILAYFVYRKNQSVTFIQILFLIFPLYIFVRIGNVITAEMIQKFVSVLFDDQRVQSLATRLLQEDLFSVKALNRPIVGWGGINRAWPVDPQTGRRMVRMIDSLWLIVFAKYGLLGLFSLFGAYGIGAWNTLRLQKKLNILTPATERTDSTLLCIIVAFSMLDYLMNGMINPIYIFCSGVLASHQYVLKEELLSFCLVKK